MSRIARSWVRSRSKSSVGKGCDGSGPEVVRNLLVTEATVCSSVPEDRSDGPAKICWVALSWHCARGADNSMRPNVSPSSVPTNASPDRFAAGVERNLHPLDGKFVLGIQYENCLLYTSDAADERS